MSDETILALIGAAAAAGGNIFVLVKAHMASMAATRAVDHSTEVSGTQHKITMDLSEKAEETYDMLKTLLAEFRVQSASDRDASFASAIDKVWHARERILLARHDEMTELMRSVLAGLSGDTPPPLTEPAPEAHSTTNVPPPSVPTTPPQPTMTPREKSPC